MNKMMTSLFTFLLCFSWKLCACCTGVQDAVDPNYTVPNNSPTFSYNINEIGNIEADEYSESSVIVNVDETGHASGRVSTKDLQLVYRFTQDSALYFNMISTHSYHPSVDMNLDKTNIFRFFVCASLATQTTHLPEYKKASNKWEIIRAFQTILQDRSELLSRTLNMAKNTSAFITYREGDKIGHFFSSAEAVRKQFASTFIRMIDNELHTRMSEELKKELSSSGALAIILNAFGENKKKSAFSARISDI